MARIRTIKPEFFKHEELFELEQETGLPVRLAFAGLWCCCDREGRFKWRPRQLKTDILPYDNVDFSRVLDALATRGFVARYACHGESFGCVPSFKTHQIINNREAGSALPGIDEDDGSFPLNNNNFDASATRQPRDDHAAIGERKGREGKGKERKGRSIGASSDAPTTGELLGDTPEKPKRATRLPADWSLPDDWREWAASNTQLTRPQIAIEAEKFSDYWTAQPGAKATKTDWQATWRNWCRRARPLNGSAKPSRHDISQIDYGPGGVYDL